MHDLLAMCLAHCTRDAAALGALPDPRRAELAKRHPAALGTLAAVLGHPEAQAFALFSALATGKRLGLAAWLGDGAEGASADAVPVVRAARRVQFELLPARDSGLARRLAASGMEPSVYAVRWLRTLFVRELPAAAAALLWDALLTDALWRHCNGPRRGADPAVEGLTLHLACELLAAAGTHLGPAGSREGIMQCLMSSPVAPELDAAAAVAAALDCSGSPLRCYVHRRPPERVVPTARRPSHRDTPPKSALAPPEEQFRVRLGERMAALLSGSEGLWLDESGCAALVARRTQLLQGLKQVRDALLDAPGGEPEVPSGQPPPLAQAF
eukprot:TRINITY_DN36428_c0_g1_i2.p1 TRINITY_DN36428_c0_g1~~TRINITY_DN36428_c0_g1_i2.p1  ORF type:complete len:327 (+),score=60.53 TRINITY_DN36428_c0_g1_i2:441-1421(+)